MEQFGSASWFEERERKDGAVCNNTLLVVALYNNDKKVVVVEVEVEVEVEKNEKYALKNIGGQRISRSSSREAAAHLTA
jgi:hypothetical protein